MSLNINTDNYNNYQANVHANDRAKEHTANAGKKHQAAEVGATYEKTEPEKKATYSINKMSAEDRAAIVDQMEQDMKARQNQLADLVKDMLSKQAGTSKLADLFSPENLAKVSAEDIAKAKEDISEDGYWGVKQTSQRLFDFASALAGDDVEKMKEMQAAMMKGFNQATGAWGRELPDICKQTINAANQLFDDYYASKNAAAE